MLERCICAHIDDVYFMLDSSNAYLADVEQRHLMLIIAFSISTHSVRISSISFQNDIMFNGDIVVLMY